MIYEANKPITLKYVTKDGETKSYDFTPEETMNRPQIIMMLKAQDKNFLKLVESENMGNHKHYIKLENVYKKPKIVEDVTSNASYIVLQDSTVENFEDGWIDILVFNKTISGDDFERIKTIVEEVKKAKPDDFTVDDIVSAIEKEFDVKDHMEVSNSRAMYIYY